MKKTGEALWGQPGFSLVELTVVLFILSALAIFSVPKFTGAGIFTDTCRNSSRLVKLVESLKIKAVTENADFYLHLDTRAGKAWVTRCRDGDPSLDRPPESGRKRYDPGVVSGLEFKGVKKTGLSHPGTRPFTRTLKFSSRGYCDGALILLGRGASAETLKIHPLLPRVEVIKGQGAAHEKG